jgi:hypothetical protein
MKSEERHQLAQNDLQVGINRWLDKIEPYSNHILAGIVVATVVAVGVILWARSSSATTEAGWSQMASARTPDDFLRIAEDNAGSHAANWARLQAARLSYSNGIETALTDRKSSDESLKQAKDLYGELVKQNTTPELREEALKGLGLTSEAVSGGDVAEAIKAYEQLIKEFPESAFSGYAAHRVEELKEPQASDFYAWFRKQNPKPAPRPQPNDGKPPIEGAIKTPELPEINLNAETEKPKGDAGTPSLPAAPSTEGKSVPAAPAAPPAAPAEGSKTTSPMPMPEGAKPAVPMPMPEASEKTAPMPMPEAPAKPAEPAKSADSSSLPSIPKTSVEPPKEP